MRATLAAIAALVIASSGAGQTRMFSLHGSAGGDNFGLSASGIGDVNFDGFGDFIVGSPYDNTHGSASVYSGFDGSVLTTFYGLGLTPPIADNFGYSVDGAGDVNNDGVPDLVVGAPQYSFTPPIGSGYVLVISGANGSTLHSFPGANPGDFFGFCVSGAGHVDGDAYADIVVGANTYTTVYSGLTGNQIFSVPFGGSCVAGVGDTNGDGFADVLIGNGTTGEVRLYRGPTGSYWLTFTSGVPYDSFGEAVAGAGDVNADGYADIIIGAHQAYIAGGAGYAKVYSGLDGSLLHTFNGDSATDRFGWSVGGAGDVNGDGKADLIVGAPYDDNTAVTSGSARVFSGLTGAALYTLNGDSANAFFGWWVSGAGLVNGDLHGDVIVGAYGESALGSFTGAAYVFSGSPLAAASMSVAGTGCGAGVPPSLGASGNPVLGQAVSLLVTNAAPLKSGFLFAAAGPAVSQPLGGGCSAYLDLNTLPSWLSLPIATDPSGSFTLTVPLSASHVFAGLTITTQAALLPTGGPLGADLTNGLTLTLGY